MQRRERLGIDSGAVGIAIPAPKINDHGCSGSPRAGHPRVSEQDVRVSLALIACSIADSAYRARTATRPLAT
jgi:hypothetical protein